MRAVTAGLFHSVDGVVEDPHLWQFDAFDEVMGQEMGAFIARADTVVMGRVGYEQWSQHWPGIGADDGFAAFINPVRKLVASRTLTGDLTWENATLVEGDLLDAVRELKATDGGEIAVCGGISIVRELLFAGLLDRLTLMTHPVVAGSGRRLFEPGDPVTRLRLDRSVTTPKGNVVSDYSVAAGA